MKNPIEILRYSYFYGHPKEFWKWHLLAYHGIKECKPNQNHVLLHQLYKQFKQKNKNFTLVT